VSEPDREACAELARLLAEVITRMGAAYGGPADANEAIKRAGAIQLYFIGALESFDEFDLRTP